MIKLDNKFTSDFKDHLKFSYSFFDCIIVRGCIIGMFRPANVINSCNSDFIATESYDGTYYFQSTSSSNLPINQYVWNFGDGSSSSYIENPSHTYASDGNYTVSLTITAGSCTAFYSKVITVDNADDCCKANECERWKYYEYITGSRKAKFVFKIRNIWPFHRVIVKTVNYKVKNNGNLTRERADIIGADYHGTIYNSNCQHLQNFVLNFFSDDNVNHYTFDDGLGNVFRVRKESLISWYRVKDEGVNKTGDALKLHNDVCN